MFLNNHCPEKVVPQQRQGTSSSSNSPTVQCSVVQVVPQQRQNTSSSQQQQPNPTDPVQARLADMTREELQVSHCVVVLGLTNI